MNCNHLSSPIDINQYTDIQATNKTRDRTNDSFVQAQQAKVLGNRKKAYKKWQSYVATSAKPRLAQLGLEGLNLRSQCLDLVCLRCDGLGLCRNQRFNLTDFACHGISRDGGGSGQG